MSCFSRHPDVWMRGEQAGTRVAELERQIAALQAQLETERKRSSEATARTAELERLYQTASQTAVLAPRTPFPAFTCSQMFKRCQTYEEKERIV